MALVILACHGEIYELTDIFSPDSMWFIMFLNAFVSGSTGTLTTYVTSDFSKHSLTATTNILTGVIPGLTKLAYAKFIDNFGRPAGLGAAITVMTLGLIMMAACSNVTTCRNPRSSSLPHFSSPRRLLTP